MGYKKDQNESSEKNSKRTNIPLEADHTKMFKADWERLNKTGRFDMIELKRVMTLIVENNGPLPAQYKDHELSAKFDKNRECHIGGDFLLMYTITKNKVVFIRAGTHAEILE